MGALYSFTAYSDVSSTHKDQSFLIKRRTSFRPASQHSCPQSRGEEPMPSPTESHVPLWTSTLWWFLSCFTSPSPRHTVVDLTKSVDASYKCDAIDLLMFGGFVVRSENKNCSLCRKQFALQSMAFEVSATLFRVPVFFFLIS